MNKLTKLTIKKFRNVAPTTLEFRPGINVLLGKNAAGKTTLLRLLSEVIGAPDEALQDDVLEVSCRVHTAFIDFERTLRRMRSAEPAIRIEPSRLVRKELSSLQQTDSFIFERDGGVVMTADVRPNEVVVEGEGRKLHLERRIWVAPFASLVLAMMEESKLGPASRESYRAIVSAQAMSAGRMDEGLERLQALLELAVRRDVSGEESSWNLGRIPQSMDEVLLGPIPEGSSATFRMEFLSNAAHVLGYESASARFDVEHLNPEPGRQTARLSNLRFFFKRPGEEISHELLSYGQKRLLAFFAHADASPDVIIADELVNGLHHEWIEACLKEIGDRQAFLTSQNPLLLDFLRFDSVEEVRRTFILCERTSTEAGAQLIWRNPTEDEAESFFSAYQTGIQRVSDILLTKGLW